MLTFKFERPLELLEVHRERNFMSIVYDFREFGRWMFEIQPGKVTIERV